MGVSEMSNDWEAVLSRSDIDAVVIATTTSTHAQLAIVAAKAGKHVLVEKPMATSLEECMEIEEAVRDAGTIMMVGFKFRFAPAVVAAKEAVAAPIVLTAHTLYDLDQSTTGWINDRSLSGGRLMSTLVHSVDLLRFLAGSEPVRVAAEGGALAIEGITEPDNAVATILFESGAIASVVHGTAGKSPVLSTWSFQSAGRGVNATVFDHGRRVQVHRSGVSGVEEYVDPTDDPFATGMRPLIDAFADSVAGGIPTAPGPRDGTIAVLVSRLIETAIATGENQQIDLSRLTYG